MHRLLSAGLAASAFLNTAAVNGAGSNMAASCAEAALSIEQLGDSPSLERDANVFVAQLAGRVLCLSEILDPNMVDGDYNPEQGEVTVTIFKSEDLPTGEIVEDYGRVTFENVLPSYPDARLEDVSGLFIYHDQYMPDNSPFRNTDESVSGYRFEDTAGLANVRVVARYEGQEHADYQQTGLDEAHGNVHPLDGAWLQEQSVRANTMLDAFSQG